MPIGRWEWNYSFGINTWTKHVRGPYLDSRSLTVFGRFAYPVELIGAPVRLHLLMFDTKDARYVEQPERVGSLSRHRETKGYEAYLFMPQDVLPSLLTMLVGERLRYVVLSGAALFRGGTEIESYRFEHEVDVAEYLAE